MKFFFGCTFLSREELATIGVKYPIKLEYYKTRKNEEENMGSNFKYGIEVIKTSYINEEVMIEKRNMPEIIADESKIEQILDKLKQYKVTPVSAEYVVEDLLKQ